MRYYTGCGERNTNPSALFLCFQKCMLPRIAGMVVQLSGTGLVGNSKNSEYRGQNQKISYSGAMLEPGQAKAIPESMSE